MVRTAPVHSYFLNDLIGAFYGSIGGVRVLKAPQAALPHDDFIYFADNGCACDGGF
jgi:glutamate racemase